VGRLKRADRCGVIARFEARAPDEIEGRAAQPAIAGSLRESIDQVVKARIESALEVARGNCAEAARNLGIDRATLWRLIKPSGFSSLRRLRPLTQYAQGRRPAEWNSK
jgi:transcriptional regulator of acetoin/glycerol metabolism